MPHRLPSLLRNRLWLPPAAMAVTPLATICSGPSLLVVVPSPSSPSPLNPIAQRLPSLFKNRPKSLPAAIAVTPLLKIFSGKL